MESLCWISPASIQVTITGAVTSISDQGTVSGSNFSSVLTDDPQTGAAGDATVTPVELPPTVGNVAVSTNEDTVLTFTAANFTGSYSDPNSDALATVRITSLPANGVLKNGAATIAAVPADIAITSIGSLTYTPAANVNGADSFGWNGSDGTLFAVSGATVNINVIAVNDAPVLAALEGAALSYTENAAATPVTATLTVADVDSANLTAATVQLTTNYANGQDLLEFTSQLGERDDPARVIDDAYHRSSRGGRRRSGEVPIGGRETNPLRAAHGAAHPLQPCLHHQARRTVWNRHTHDPLAGGGREAQQCEHDPSHGDHHSEVEGVRNAWHDAED